MNVQTRSMWGPFSTEFQFQAVSDCQFVQPSWCLLVNTMYLQLKQQTKVIFQLNNELSFPNSEGVHSAYLGLLITPF